MEIENLERLLLNFKNFSKDTNTSALLLVKYGFDFNGKQVHCTKCDYSNSNYLYLTFQALIRDHLVRNSNCSNSKNQIAFINYIDSIDSVANNNSLRNPISKVECEKTFEGTNFTEIAVNELVENGFFMTDNSNSNLVHLECCKCGYKTIVFRTRRYNIHYVSPFKEHQEKQPNCFYNLTEKFTNVNKLVNIEDESLREALNMVINTNNNNYRPFNSGYETENSRKDTFHSWPLDKNSINSFVKSGFYYLGNKDLVHCFNCNGGIKNWDPIDDPFDEHARWFPRCSYLRELKGGEFIEKIKIRYADMNSGFNENYDTNNTHHYYNHIVGDINMKNSLKSIGSKDTNDPNYDYDSRNLKFSQRDVNARIETASIQKMIKVLNLDENILKNVIKKKFETTGTDFESLIELTKAYHEYDQQTTNSKNHIKKNFHLYFSNLPIGINESQMRSLFANKFKLNIRSIK
jgi:hypothetical protein